LLLLSSILFDLEQKKGGAFAPRDLRFWLSYSALASEDPGPW
jgi:hypothetical protein